MKEKNSKLVKVDLAAGNNKREGFIGVDIADIDSVDIVHDLNTYPWPFEDNSVDEVHCSHYVEHIPHEAHIHELVNILKKGSYQPEDLSKILEDTRDGLIKFIDEIYRILKPKGKVTLIFPYYMSTRAFGDPTHRRYVGDLSFPYFNKEWRKVNKLEHYGINSDFDIKGSYVITNELTLKSEQVRNEAFIHSWNAIDDMVIEMIKQ